MWCMKCCHCVVRPRCERVTAPSRAAVSLFGCIVLYVGAGFAMGLSNGLRGTKALPHAQQWGEVFKMARSAAPSWTSVTLSDA